MSNQISEPSNTADPKSNSTVKSPLVTGTPSIETPGPGSPFSAFARRN
jgi:hypothetical protein